MTSEAELAGLTHPKASQRDPAVYFLQREAPPITMAPMTICIAAICESGKAIVLAADRCRWGDDKTCLQTESDDRKIEILNDRLAFSGAGSTGLIEDVLAELRGNRSQDGGSIRSIARKLLETCQAIRVEFVERSYLIPQLGMTYQEFKDRVLAPSGSVFNEVCQIVRNTKLSLQLMLCGFDFDGAQLYYVDDVSLNNLFDSGFHAIGTGAVQSLIALSRRGQTKSRSVAETVFNVYEAGRLAELARGVGKKIDIAVLRHGRDAAFLKDDDLSKLEAIYLNKLPPKLTSVERKSIESLLA